LYVPTFPSTSGSNGAYSPAVRPQAEGSFESALDRPCSRFSSFLLDIANPRPHSRVVLFGSGTFALGCELIRHGLRDVGIVWLTNLSDGTSTDIAIVPHASTARQIKGSVAAARRMMVSTGVLVMGDVSLNLLGLTTECLQLHGFARPCCWTGLRGLVVRAKLPANRTLPCT